MRLEQPGKRCDVVFWPRFHATKNQVSTRSTSHWFSFWWFEIASAVLSIACIVGLAVVLYKIDGKPYQAWRLGNVDITPNSMLSILSTVSKASFMLPVAEAIGQLKWTYFQQRPHPLMDIQRFDDASRGPLGAVILLWTMKVQAIVASLGAVITILALATDPFTQQVLSYPSSPTNVTNVTATIAATRIFDTGPYTDVLGKVVLQRLRWHQDASC